MRTVHLGPSMTFGVDRRRAFQERSYNIYLDILEMRVILTDPAR